MCPSSLNEIGLARLNVVHMRSLEYTRDGLPIITSIEESDEGRFREEYDDAYLSDERAGPIPYALLTPVRGAVALRLVAGERRRAASAANNSKAIHPFTYQ